MDELAKLRWQCRRGIRELDLMLSRYLETRYLVADQQERELFKKLLGMEDDHLIRFLMGRSETGNMELLVEKLKCIRVL